MAKEDDNKEATLTEGIADGSDTDKETKKKEKKRIKVGHRYIRKEVHDILQRYFDLDDENGIATINVHYETLSDIFIIPEDESKSLIIKKDVLDKFDEQIKMLPNAYKVKFVIKIDDYEDYDPDEIKEVMYDNVRLTGYNVGRDLRNKTLVSLALLLVGIVFLVINIWYSSATDNDEGLVYLIFSEIFDVAAWVFIWEAVTKFFIERSEVRNGARLTGQRLSGIEFVDREGHIYLEEQAVTEVMEELEKDGEDEED